MSTLRILSPVAETRTVERPLADRPSALARRRIALLDNQKANAGLLLEEVGRHLAGANPDMVIERERKIATSPSPDEVLGRLQTVDAVVLAIAD
ncbi:MAG: hypothetical protein AAFN30_09635 [Actinomycetota bacterium]